MESCQNPMVTFIRDASELGMFLATPTLPYFSVAAISAAHWPLQRPKLKNTKVPRVAEGMSYSNAGFGANREEPLWLCVEGCVACCKLAKGPAFATPEEVFTNHSDIELYKMLVGPDGWCIHYEKSTRKCSIYSGDRHLLSSLLIKFNIDRPYFCLVEPEIFRLFYGINKKKFNRKASSSCRDTIKAIYGSRSEELANFNRSLKSSD